LTLKSKKTEHFGYLLVILPHASLPRWFNTAHDVMSPVAYSNSTLCMAVLTSLLLRGIALPILQRLSFFLDWLIDCWLQVPFEGRDSGKDLLLTCTNKDPAHGAADHKARDHR